MNKIAIIGAGAFGTSLAIALAQSGNEVCLVARTKEVATELSKARANLARLGPQAFPSTMNISHILPDDAEIVLVAVPTQSVRASISSINDALEGKPVVACFKGIEKATGLRAVEILEDIAPKAKTAIMSGPSFATDIANGLPTALTLGAVDPALGTSLQRALSAENIRLYRSDDVTGVELGGSLKNVIAIAAGLVSGAGLGESARAAIMTRGFAELSKFAMAQGANIATLSGLSGFGDLVLTCTSGQSRNYSFGQSIGKNGSRKPTATVEGVASAFAVANLAKMHKIDMPITNLVCQILDESITIQDATKSLLARPLKDE